MLIGVIVVDGIEATLMYDFSTNILLCVSTSPIWCYFASKKDCSAVGAFFLGKCLKTTGAKDRCLRL